MISKMRFGLGFNRWSYSKTRTQDQIIHVGIHETGGPATDANVTYNVVDKKKGGLHHIVEFRGAVKDFASYEFALVHANSINMTSVGFETQSPFDERQYRPDLHGNPQRIQAAWAVREYIVPPPESYEAVYQLVEHILDECPNIERHYIGREGDFFRIGKIPGLKVGQVPSGIISHHAVPDSTHGDGDSQMVYIQMRNEGMPAATAYYAMMRELDGAVRGAWVDVMGRGRTEKVAGYSPTRIDQKYIDAAKKAGGLYDVGKFAWWVAAAGGAAVALSAYQRYKRNPELQDRVRRRWDRLVRRSA